MLFPDRMTDNGLPLLWSCFPGIGEINLMMHAGIREIILITVLIKVSVHHGNGRRLIIIGSVMHHLHAKTLGNRQELGNGAIDLFLLGRCADCPVKILFCDEIRQTYDGYPVE